MNFPRWERWGALTGLATIVCWFGSLFVEGNTPNTTDSNGSIVSFYAGHTHQVRQIAALFVFLAGNLFWLGFLGVLRSRLFDAEGAPGRLTTVAFASGVASSLFLLAGAVWFAAPAIAANDTHKFQLDPNTFRIFSDTGVAFWIGGVVIAAVLVWIASLIALRSSVLPKWFAWLGLLVAVVQLFAILFIPILISWAG